MKPALDHAVPIHVGRTLRKRKFNLYALSPNLLQKVVWFPLRPFFKFFIHFKIEGTKRIENLDQGIIFAANHSSEFDPILMASAMPFLSKHMPFFYLTRGPDFYKQLGWYARALYGGLFFKLWGGYPIESGTGDYAKALYAHLQLLQDNQSVCIFPEGHLQRSGVLARAHGGISYLLWKTEKPIVPVAISGVADMGLFSLLRRERTVTIRFGAPLYSKEFFAHLENDPIVNEEKNDFTEASQAVMEKIRVLLTEPLT